MFASAGDNQLAIIFHVPAPLAEKLSLKEWVDTVSGAIGAEIVEMGAEVAKISVAADPVSFLGGGRLDKLRYCYCPRVSLTGLF